MRFTTRILMLVSLAASFAHAQTLNYQAPPPFSHIVIIVQENRTPDNLFGAGRRSTRDLRQRGPVRDRRRHRQWRTHERA